MMRLQFVTEKKSSIFILFLLLLSQSIMAQLNPSDYEYNMSLTSRLFVDGQLISEENDYQIVVKDSSSVVGMSDYDVAIPNAGMFSFMTIYAHNYTDEYNVYIVDLEGNEIMVDSDFIFTANQVMGGVLNPITHVLGDVIIGCTDEGYLEYNQDAEADDGSCETLIVLGCTDSIAFNYNSLANIDDGSCVEDISGCTDANACNYNSNATTDDESCMYIYSSIQEYSWNNPYVTVFTDAENPIYEWFYEGELLDEMSSVLAPESNGDYHVLIIDESGCSTSIDFSINTLSIESGVNLNYEVYPNPVQDIITVEVPISDKDVKVELVNLYGQVVMGYIAQIKNNQIIIDVSELSPSIYFLRIDEGVNIKLIKS
jgi:hypothetical protein